MINFATLIASSMAEKVTPAPSRASRHLNPFGVAADTDAGALLKASFWAAK